ncbi:MAG: ATP-grasp domain-containing protein, partial [Pseudomonadota bacterium]
MRPERPVGIWKRCFGRVSLPTPDPILRMVLLRARGADGSTVAYEPGENAHEAGILRRTVVPAGSSPDSLAEAKAIAGRILDALDYVGVIGVE